EQIGPPLELYERPATRFVAGFIGSPAMNFLPGIAVPGGVRLDGGAILRPPAALSEGRRVVVGIRPEHLAPSAAADGALPVRVERGTNEQAASGSAGNFWAIWSPGREKTPTRKARPYPAEESPPRHQDRGGAPPPPPGFASMRKPDRAAPPLRPISDGMSASA